MDLGPYLRIGLMGTLLVLSLSCKILVTMNKKKTTKIVIYNSRYHHKGGKGIKIEGESETLQDDSMSIKEMLQKHVQGVLDPSKLMEGQYDPDTIEHEDDVTERQQTSLIDALDYANENKMTKQEVEEAMAQIEEVKEAPQEDSSQEEQSTNEDGE